MDKKQCRSTPRMAMCKTGCKFYRNQPKWVVVACHWWIQLCKNTYMKWQFITMNASSTADHHEDKYSIWKHREMYMKPLLFPSKFKGYFVHRKFSVSWMWDRLINKNLKSCSWNNHCRESAALSQKNRWIIAPVRGWNTKLTWLEPLCFVNRNFL